MKRACVIGWPIEHSRSPLIHGHWLQRYGIAGSYEKLPVEPERLADFVRGMRAGGFSGGNFTVPHKQALYALADERDASAVAVGAANTLWFDGTRLCVANTDTYGFMTALSEAAPDWQLRDAPVTVIGAGGAARAIVHGFLAAGAPAVRIVNRSRERADQIEAQFGRAVQAFDWSEQAQALSGGSVIVNTTTLGMAGQPTLSLDLTALGERAVVADIVYVPLITPLLAAAAARGLRTVDGLGMLLHQAVPGFERWFGQRPAVTRELRQLIEADIRVVTP